MRAPLLFVSAILAVASLSFAGDLNPPPGPVVQTMKPLDEVEPRIAVNAINTPGVVDAVFEIRQPGSYYLTGNVQGVPSRDGILIMADNVTLDLNGYTVQGVSGAGDGISVGQFSFHSGIRVTNGVIRDWPQRGIVLRADGSQIDHIRFTGNVTWAIDAQTSFGLALSECTSLLDGNSGSGGSFDGAFLLAEDATVRNCHVRDCQGAAFFASSSEGVFSFENCSVKTASDIGFSASGASVTLVNCSASSTGRQGFFAGGRSASLSGCAAAICGEEGFLVRSYSASLRGCTVDQTIGSGIALGAVPGNPNFGSATLRDCSVSRTASACFFIATPARLENCSAAEGATTLYQFTAASTLERCSATGAPLEAGIIMSGGCVVRNSTVRLTSTTTPAAIIVFGDNAEISGNSIVRSAATLVGDGIRVDAGRALLEGNTINGFSSGINILSGAIQTTALRNLFQRVTFPFQTTGGGGGTAIAPVVTVGGLGAATNPFANFVN